MSHATFPFTRMSHATFPLPACHTPPSLYPHTAHPCPCPCTHTHASARTTPAHRAAQLPNKASALRRSAIHQSQRITPLGHTPKPAHCVARPHTKTSALRRSATHQNQRITSLGHTPKPAHCVARPHTKASALRRSATHQNNKTLLLKPAHWALRRSATTQSQRMRRSSTHQTPKPAHCGVAWPFTISYTLYRASRVRRGGTTSLCPPSKPSKPPSRMSRRYAHSHS